MDSLHWFWTEHWQEMERKVQEDIDNDRVIHFDNVEDAIAYLDSLSEE